MKNIIENHLKIKNMRNNENLINDEGPFKRNNGGIVQIYRLPKDDINSIMEEQNRMSENLNLKLKIAGTVEYF
jgi:hypothetical protein